MVDAEPETWARPDPTGEHVLVMIVRSSMDFRAYGGYYVIEYLVRTSTGELEIDLGVATWADWDQSGRLVVARDGKLLAWKPTSGLSEIADFNSQQPDPHPAPDWALEWPVR